MLLAGSWCFWYLLLAGGCCFWYLLLAGGCRLLLGGGFCLLLAGSSCWWFWQSPCIFSRVQWLWHWLFGNWLFGNWRRLGTALHENRLRNWLRQRPLPSDRVRFILRTAVLFHHPGCSTQRVITPHFVVD